MCGIVGSTGLYNHKTIKKMCRVLKHRGPDSEGFYFDENIAFGMRRLKIIDLDKGDQPIFNTDKSIVTVFNGEIYNYKKLRNNLKNNGIILKTKSDTETIVFLYQKYGYDFVKELRGMFAIAIWDKRNERLVLARDRVGIKPLYYYYNNKILLFSSEIKSLLVHPKVSKELNFNALHHYFTFGYIPAPLSIFKNIHKVLPGHLLIYENHTIKSIKYWDVPNNDLGIDYLKNQKEIEQQLLKLIEESIELHMISDVPVGAFLSGGLDSGSVVALASKLSNQPIKTFSIGFDDSYLNELDNAKLVANMYKTDHTEYIVEPTDIDVLENIMYYYDEPFADSSAIPTYFVSKFASDYVKVALSGDGGDEIFAGYGNYKADKIYQILNKLPFLFKNKFIELIVRSLPQSNNLLNIPNQIKKIFQMLALEPEMAHVFWLSIINEDEKNKLYKNNKFSIYNQIQSLELYDNYFQLYKNKDFINTCINVDIKTVLPDDYLTKVDRASMANSIEVRVPFLDHKLLEFCTSIPSEMKLQGFTTKKLLKNIMKNELPEKVRFGRKKGFSIPLNRWFKQDYKSLFDKYLSAETIEKKGYFDSDYITNLKNEHLNGYKDNSKLLWSLVTFEIWQKNYYID